MNKVERINQLLAVSARLREQLEAVSTEFVELHGYEVDHKTFASIELYDVCWCGTDYDEAMHNIMERKKLPQNRPR